MTLFVFLAKRIGRGLLTLWFAVTITFLLLRLLPGDPALAVASMNMDDAMKADILTRYGLTDPLYVQYVKYMGQLLQGNLGISFTQNIPVSHVLLERLPWTILLATTSIVGTVIVGVTLGVAAAVRRGRITDRLVQLFSVVGESVFIPSVAVLLLYVLGLQLKWFPIGGAYDVGVYGAEWYLNVAWHLALPAASMVLVQVGAYALTMRATLLETLGQDYVTLAKANGLPYRRILWNHAVRNALLPIVTLTGLRLGYLVGGAILIETVFAYPGIGRGIYEAVTQLDYPTLQGAFILLAATVIAANLVTDITYSLLDPRVRMA